MFIGLLSGFFSWIWDWPPNHRRLGSTWLPTLSCQLGTPPCTGSWKECLLINSHLAAQSQTTSHLSPHSASSPRQGPTSLPLPTSSFPPGTGLSHFLPTFPPFPKPLPEGPASPRAPPSWGPAPEGSASPRAPPPRGPRLPESPASLGPRLPEGPASPRVPPPRGPRFPEGHWLGSAAYPDTSWPSSLPLLGFSLHFLLRSFSPEVEKAHG